MTFPAVQTKVTTSKSQSSPFTLTLPASIAAGDMMFMFLIRDIGGQTFTWPAGWTQVFSLNDDSNNSTVAAAWKIAVGGETSISVTSSFTSSRAIIGGAYRIDFTATAAAVEAATATVSATAPSSISLTPSWGALDTLGSPPWAAAMGRP